MRSCLYLPSMKKESTFASGQNANRRFFVCLELQKKRREYRDDWADWTLPTLCLLSGCLEISWGKITGLLAGSAEGLEANWSPKHISSPTDVHCSIFVVAYRFQKELISASSLACLPEKILTTNNSKVSTIKIVSNPCHTVLHYIKADVIQFKVQFQFDWICFRTFYECHWTSKSSFVVYSLHLHCISSELTILFRKNQKSLKKILGCINNRLENWNSIASSFNPISNVFGWFVAPLFIMRSLALEKVFAHI